MNSGKLLICSLIVLSMMSVPFSAYAGKDTADTVMSVAKEGTAAASDAATAGNEASAFFNRLATDKDYAGKFLQAIQKSDANGAVSIMKLTMPRSEITPGKINPDFHFDFTVHVGKSTYKACVSSDHSCDGHNTTLG